MDDARNEQFWGFNPQHFTGDVMNCIEDYLNDGFDHLEKVMVAHNAGTKSKAVKLAQGVDYLLDQVSDRIKKNTIVLQSYILKNILSVPNDLVLPEGAGGASGAEGGVDATEEALDAEISALVAQVEEAKYTRRVLQQEGRKLRGEKRVYEQLVTAAAGLEEVKEAETKVFGAEDPSTVSKVREVISKARIYVQETSRLKQAVSQRPDLVVGMGLGNNGGDESGLMSNDLGIPDTEDMGYLAGFEGSS